MGLLGLIKYGTISNLTKTIFLKFELYFLWEYIFVERLKKENWYRNQYKTVQQY